MQGREIEMSRSQVRTRQLAVLLIQVLILLFLISLYRAVFLVCPCWFVYESVNERSEDSFIGRIVFRVSRKIRSFLFRVLICFEILFKLFCLGIKAQTMQKNVNDF